MTSRVRASEQFMWSNDLSFMGAHCSWTVASRNLTGYSRFCHETHEDRHLAEGRRRVARRTLETGTEQLRCEVENGVATITLNRPDKRNALSNELTPALRQM